MTRPPYTYPAPMASLKLSKAHRLCSQTSIDRLFAASQSRQADTALAYPLRAVWYQRRGYDATSGPALKFLISIPKKRLHKAVDRVLMRRRVREAYRLARHSLVPSDTDRHLAVAFIYVADKPVEYRRVSAAMSKILRRIFPAAAATTPACVADSAAPQAETPAPQTGTAVTPTES